MDHRGHGNSFTKVSKNLLVNKTWNADVSGAPVSDAGGGVLDWESGEPWSRPDPFPVEREEKIARLPPQPLFLKSTAVCHFSPGACIFFVRPKQYAGIRGSQSLV